MRNTFVPSLIAGFVLTIMPSLNAADGAIVTDAQKQLASAVAELAALRETIASEKLPVAAELRELESSLFDKRRERDRVQRLRDNTGVELGSLESQLKARTDELTYVGNLLGDYTNRLNAALHPAEVNLLSERILAVLNLGEKSDMTRGARLEAQAGALLIGIERLKESAGGRSFDGSAVLPDGRFEAGKFVLLGPLGLYATADGSAAGLAERGTSAGPRVVVFDPGATSALAGLVTSGSGEIPIDPTEGRAIAMAATRESFIEHIQKGGLWMYPILGFAFLAMVIGVFKFIEIQSVKVPPPVLVDEVLELMREGKTGEAERHARAQAGPVAAMIGDGVKYSRLPKELLDEVMFERMLEVKPKLERGLSLITVTAAVAPLLGLLGTVTGMINTFKAITVFGTGDAKSLSSGISEALITTEYGLIVAIPALLLGSFLSRRASGLIATMERMSINFVNGVAVIRETRVTGASERADEPVAAA